MLCNDSQKDACVNMPRDSDSAKVTALIDKSQQAFYDEMVRGVHANGERGRIIFCVSTDDLSEGRGDPYVALGLAKYLNREGWGVSLWPMSRWHEVPTPAPTVAIAMVESFIPGMLPATTATIAWIRNWADSWAQLPYLEEFDGIWTSSQLSTEVMNEHYSGRVFTVPIGVDLELFANRGGGRRTLPVITTANFWGAERTIQKSLATLARTTQVTWFGANGEHLVVDSAVHHADRVDFFGLPSIYARSIVVVDDLIDAAKVYGNQNSRLFEAIASGAVPVTNTRLGLDSLGLGEVPSYSDEASLAATVTSLLSSRTTTSELATRLRETVIARHSYESRAAEVQPHIATALARAASRDDRPAILAWANEERRRLQSAESLRDGHLITIRRMERELEQLQRKLDITTAKLDEFRSSRWAQYSLRVQRRIARMRKQ